MKKKKHFTSFIYVVLCLLIISSLSLSQDYRNSLKPGAKELMNMRTEYSKTFINADSSYTTMIFTYKIHHKNEKGSYEEIKADDIQSGIDGTSNITFYKPYSHTAGWEYYNNYSQFGYDNFNNADKQKRSYVWWSTNSIPTSATINSASVHMVRISGGSITTTFKIHKMVNNWGPNPSQNNAFTIWNECLSGEVYFSTNSGTSPFDFATEAFKSDLQSRLLLGQWMEMALTNDHESTDDGDYFKTYIAEYMTVNWTAPLQLCVDPPNWSPDAYPGQSKRIDVINCIQGGGSFQFSVTNNNSDWISVNDLVNTTPGHFNLIVSANYTCYQRIGTVTVSASGVQGSPKTVTVTQTAAASIDLPNQQVQGLQIYKATDWIHVNDFVVSQTGNVNILTLIAGNNITLNPGFIASCDGNCSFQAVIQSCGTIVDKGRISNNIYTNGMVNSPTENDRVVKQENTDLPDEYSLNQNYPNPFNPTTNIKYSLKENVKVTLKIYNILGKEIITLVDEYQQAGYKSIYWNGLDSQGFGLPSGLYIYRIIAGDFVKARKMVLLK